MFEILQLPLQRLVLLQPKVLQVDILPILLQISLMRSDVLYKVLHPMSEDLQVTWVIFALNRGRLLLRGDPGVRCVVDAFLLHLRHQDADVDAAQVTAGNHHHHGDSIDQGGGVLWEQHQPQQD